MIMASLLFLIYCSLFCVTENTTDNWQGIKQYWNKSTEEWNGINKYWNETVHPKKETRSVNSNERDVKPRSKTGRYFYDGIVGRPVRLIKGEKAEMNQFPYMVSVQYKGLIFTYHVCGGAVITRFYIITAAHCVEEERKYFVESGLLTFEQSTNETQIVDVSEILTHQRFIKNRSYVQNDIALLRLNRPLRWSDSTSPIKLPMSDQEFEGEATVCGWGKTEQGIESMWLRFIDVQLVSTIECNDELKKRGDDLRVLDTNLCSSGSSGMSACFGDSGSPLVQDKVLVGIVSWGSESCGKSFEPTVYTKCSKYTNWIKSRLTFT